jgi:hypothetical protein
MIRTKDTLPETEHREPTFELAMDIVLEMRDQNVVNSSEWYILNEINIKLYQTLREHDTYIRARRLPK